MIAVGSTAAAVPHTQSVPVPTSPRSRPEDDVVARVERAHSWRSPIILREGPDPDAVARLIRQGRLVEAPAAEQSPAAPTVLVRTDRKRKRGGRQPQAVRPPSWDVDEAKRLSGEGWTLRGLAQRYGVSGETVRYHLLRNGHTFPARGSAGSGLDARVAALPDGEADRIRRLVLGGLTRREAAQETGYRYDLVQHVCQGLTPERVNNPTLTPESTRRLLADYDNPQLTVQAIATKYDVSLRTVRRTAEAAGKIRRKGADDLYGLLRANGATNADVRLWAAGHGYPIPRSGPTSRATVEAYLAAHRTVTATSPDRLTTREDSPA